MSLAEYAKRQTREFLFGDRPIYGRLRSALLVLAPLVLLIFDYKWAILGQFSAFYRKLIVIYFLALMSAFVSAVAYIKDIYGLDSNRMPLRHFVSTYFGLFVPKVKISNKMHDSDWKNMIELIGGPAFLNIEPGYAVLTETLTSPANLYGQGRRQFITRQERIQEIIDLHEQEGLSAEVRAVTRDGIAVIVENMKYNYRLWDAQWEAEPATQTGTENPFPFSKDAVHNLVYSRTVAVDDQGYQKPFSWMGVVGRRVQGILKNYISEHQLDDVIATREYLKENPRELIRALPYEPEFKKNMSAIGTILRWWDPGEFRSLDTIEGQYLSNWSVDVKSSIQINRAYGEAQKQAYAELGRAEAEAELLMSIIHSLDGIRFGDDKTQTLQNLILMRTAQVIRAMNASTQDERIKQSNDSKTKQDAKE